jgi:hypothetical protein
VLKFFQEEWNEVLGFIVSIGGLGIASVFGLRHYAGF